MSIPRIGFAVSFDGCPYVFATDGVQSISTTDPNYPDNATVLNGWLIGPNEDGASTSRIETALDIVNGDVSVSQFTVKLHDKKVSVNGALWNISTYLFTRDEELFPTAKLAASMTASATSFTVLNPTNISSYIPGVVWIEQEAINCSAINTGTGIVTVAASGRGYYASIAKAHTVNAELAQYQEVFAAFPWINRRRMVFWETLGLGANVDVTSRWFGYANRPRLGNDGATFGIQAEHVRKIDGDKPLGQVDAVTQLRGYNTQAVALGTILGTNNFTTTVPTNAVYNTFLGALSAQATYLTNAVASQISPPTTNAFFSTAYSEGNSAVVRGTSVGFNSILVQAWIADTTPVTRTAVNPAGGTLTAVTPPLPIPRALVFLPLTGAPIPLTSVANIPTTAGATGGGALEAVNFAPTLRGDYDERHYVVIRPATSSPVTDYDATVSGPSYNGYASFELKPQQAELSAVQAGIGYANGVMVNYDMPLFSIVRCDANHWLAAMRYTIDSSVGGTLLNHGINSNHWDFTTYYNSVMASTMSPTSTRTYNFDGSKKLAETFLEECKASGCCLATTYNGKLTVIAIKQPTPNTSTTTLNYVTDFPHNQKPTWKRFDDFPINRVEVSVPGVTNLGVVNQRSVDRYGIGRTVEVKLESLNRPEVVLDNPIALATQVFQRILGLYDRPIDVIRVPLRWSQRDNAAAGKWIKITDWLAPNGQGTRGNTERVGMVINHDMDYRSGTVWVTALCLRNTYGYAPSCRVASISGATLTIATAYIRGVGDYAGSNTVQYSGTGNDGGTSKFVAGDKVRLVLWDTTTKTVESFTVQSVNAAAKTITLTASVPTSPYNWPSLATTGIVTLEYDEFATCTTTQRSKYAFWGNATTEVIDGTATNVREWSV